MWYALIGDEQVGPLSPEGMAALRLEGRLEDSTYVWREGLADWLPLAQVGELLNAMAAFTPAPADELEELDDSEIRAEEEGATLMMDGDQGKDWAKYLDALAQSNTPLAAAVSAPLRGPDSVSHATGEQRAVQSAAARAEPLIAAPAPGPAPRASAPGPASRPSVPGARPLSFEPAGPPAGRDALPEPPLAPPPEIDFGSMLEPDSPADAGLASATVPVQAPAPAGGGKLKVWLILLPLLGATAAAVVLWVRHAQQNLGPPATPAPISDTAPVDTAPPTAAPTAAPTQPPTQPPSAAATAAPSAVAAPSLPPSAASEPPQPTVIASAEAPKPVPRPVARPSQPAAAPVTVAPAPSPADAAATKTLSRNEIMGVVNASMGGIKACGAQQPDLTGTLSVATTIERDGSVSAAQVTTSRFRGSPVGTCIEQKIKALRFPKFGADPVRFNLPLIL